MGYIAAEIEKELLTLQELLNEMATIRLRNDIVSKRAKGSILHDFYNCCERIFKKIAIELNSVYFLAKNYCHKIWTLTEA